MKWRTAQVPWTNCPTANHRGNRHLGRRLCRFLLQPGGETIHRGFVVDSVISFGGIIGNILMFCVVMRKSQRKVGMSVFMAALALTDTIVLLMDFINYGFKYEVKIYLMGMDLGFCVIHRFFYNVAYTYSAWLVVGVSVERFIAVTFPSR